MIDALLASPLFGVVLTATCWCIGVWAQKKTKHVLCNPLVVAAILIITFLVALRIPYSAYRIGGDVITLMLGPTTAVLALNIYNQKTLLKEYFFPVVIGCLVGSLVSVVSVLLVCRLLAVDSAITNALVPKSVTTAIALAIAESRGGIVGITSASVLVTGAVGAIFAPFFAKLFRVSDPVAEGVAIGACSHALGTTKALEIGALQGAMSSIAICICGIITSILVLFF